MTKHPWLDLTAEQREWFAKGWNVSAEGFNAGFGPSPAGAWDYLVRGARDGFYEDLSEEECQRESV